MQLKKSKLINQCKLLGLAAVAIIGFNISVPSAKAGSCGTGQPTTTSDTCGATIHTPCPNYGSACTRVSADRPLWCTYAPVINCKEIEVDNGVQVYETVIGKNGQASCANNCLCTSQTDTWTGPVTVYFYTQACGTGGS